MWNWEVLASKEKGTTTMKYQPRSSHGRRELDFNNDMMLYDCSDVVDLPAPRITQGLTVSGHIYNCPGNPQ